MENPDTGLHVEFFTKPVEHPRKSKEEGRPIFEDREMVRIRFPGDNKRELVAPAHEMHYHEPSGGQVTYAERFDRHYEVFQREGVNAMHGTPVDRLPGISGARAQELKAQQVHTVEQLAQMTDQSGKRLGMGWMALREDAKAFLEAAKTTANVDALQARIAELEAMVAAPKPEPVAGDPYRDFTEEDLKNMIKDAGEALPRGNASRATLVAKLQDITAKANEAA